MKKQLRMVIFAILVFQLIWAPTALCVDIQIGGGAKLDLSRFQVLHQETFDSASPEKAFWGRLGIGSKPNDAWTGALTGGVYVLANDRKPEAVRYYFRQNLEEGNPRTLSEYPVSVEISGKMTGQVSAAGLLYGYNPQTKHYIAFVKGSGSSYAIYKKDENGLKKVTGGTSNAVRVDQVNQLAIVPETSKINFYINSTYVASINDASANSGGSGLVAISSGMFNFDNFTIYNASSSTPVPSNQNGNDQVPVVTPEEPEALTEPAEALEPVENMPAESSEAQKNHLQSYMDILATGMSRQEVIQLFGSGWQRGSRLFYDMGTADDSGMDSSTLIIEFDENDKVVSYKVSQL